MVSSRFHIVFGQSSLTMLLLLLASAFVCCFTLLFSFTLSSSLLSILFPFQWSCSRSFLPCFSSFQSSSLPFPRFHYCQPSSSISHRRQSAIIVNQPSSSFSHHRHSVIVVIQSPSSISHHRQSVIIIIIVFFYLRLLLASNLKSFPVSSFLFTRLFLFKLSKLPFLLHFSFFYYWTEQHNSSNR
jgi:hypothetical protein